MPRKAWSSGRSVAFAALAVLATALGVVWGVRDRSRPGLEGDPPSPARREDVLPPALAAARRLDALDIRFDRSAQEDGARPPDHPASTATVKGRVLVGGEPARGGVAYAVLESPSFVLMGKSEIDSKGTFELAVTLTSSARVNVGVLVPGFQRTSNVLHVVPDSIQHVEFDLGRGRTLAGVIVDQVGAPIPGLPIFVTSNPNVTSAARSGKYFASDELKYATSRSDYYEGEAVTDALGGFSVTGLGDATYLVLTSSRDWFIRQDYGRAVPGAADLRFTAEPGLTLDVRAIHAVSGEDLPEFRCRIGVGVAGVEEYAMPLEGAMGKASVTWKSLRAGRETREGMDLSVSIEAPSMEARSVVVTYPPGTHAQVLRVALQPMTLGWARLRVVDARGDFVDLPLSATLVAYRDGDSRPRLSEYPRIDLQKVPEPGMYRLEAGVGSWWCSVRPRHELGALVAWRGMLDIPRGNAGGEATVTLPEFGLVRIRARVRGGTQAHSARRLQLTRRNPGVTTGIGLAGPMTEIRGFPVGEWVARLAGSNGGWERRFSVESGAVLDIELPEE